MRQARRLPYLFLGGLLIIVIFLGGIKYGQKVEQANKIINYITHLKPTATPTPMTVSYITFSNKGCGIQFVYPSNLKVVKAATEEAYFKGGDQQIQINCNKTVSPTPEPKGATKEATFKAKKLSVTSHDGLYSFSVKNPVNAKTLRVTVSENLFSLFEKTLEYKAQ